MKNNKKTYIVKDENENIIKIKVSKSFIKILEAMDKGDKKK